MSDTRQDTVPRDLFRRAAIDFIAAGALVAIGVSGQPPAFALATAAIYITIVALALTGLPGHAPHLRFGSANRVTLLRAVLVSFFAGAAATAPEFDTRSLWFLAGVGMISTLLDGVDGALARRHGTASRFGARFDQEIDALFILLLSVLVWRLGHSGPWVLAIGGMRYGFLALGWLAPVFRRPLPQRRRRQAICVLQIFALLACVPPLLSPLLRDWLTVPALAALSLSFAMDIAALARSRHVADMAA